MRASQQETVILMKQTSETSILKLRGLKGHKEQLDQASLFVQLSFSYYHCGSFVLLMFWSYEP